MLEERRLETSMDKAEALRDARQPKSGMANPVGLEVSCAQAGYRVEFLGVEGFKELGFGVDLIGELGQKLAQAVG